MIFEGQSQEENQSPRDLDLQIPHLLDPKQPQSSQSPAPKRQVGWAVQVGRVQWGRWGQFGGSWRPLGT